MNDEDRWAWLRGDRNRYPHWQPIDTPEVPAQAAWRLMDLLGPALLIFAVGFCAGYFAGWQP